MSSEAFPTYQAALDWLFTTTDYEKMRRVRYNADTFSLSRMGALVERLGNPHRGGTFLHVAGTKGKGSTCRMLSEVLQAAGHRTGLYTSPHVEDLRERMALDGRWIEPEVLRDLVSRARPAVEAMRAEPDIRAPTFFEILTAAAFLFFREARADVVVLEVGLGGRLDATNVVTPLVAAITSLSLDHTAQLGATVDLIAFEKAGIVKPGVPVVTAPQPPEAFAVIERVAAERAAPLTVVGRDVRVTACEPAEREGRCGLQVSLEGRTGAYSDLWAPLVGRHQAVNAAVALGVLERAGERGLAWDEEALREGLSRSAPAARIQVLRRRPWVVNDGAHNPASIRALVETIRECFPHRRLILVFAAAADKDYAGGLAEVLPITDHLVLTTSGTPRSVAPAELAAAAARIKAVPAKCFDDARAAAERALALADPEDLVCFTGSFYLAGIVAAWWKERGGAQPPMDADGHR